MIGEQQAGAEPRALPDGPGLLPAPTPGTVPRIHTYGTARGTARRGLAALVVSTVLVAIVQRAWPVVLIAGTGLTGWRIRQAVTRRIPPAYASRFADIVLVWAAIVGGTAVGTTFWVARQAPQLAAAPVDPASTPSGTGASATSALVPPSTEPPQRRVVDVAPAAPAQGAAPGPGPEQTAVSTTVPIPSSSAAGTAGTRAAPVTPASTVPLSTPTSTTTATTSTGAPVATPAPTTAPDPVPVARTDRASVNAGGSVTIDLLANDQNVESGAAMQVIQSPTGEVALSGQIATYTASGTEPGAVDSFTYEVCNPGGRCAHGVVRIDIVGG